VDHPILEGERVTLRPVADADRLRLRAILAEPEVARWWALSSVVSDSGEPDDSEVELVIQVDDEVVGAIQYAEEDDPDYRHAGVDIYLTTALHGQGVGPDAIRTLARYLFEERGHHRLTIDPAAHNRAAIRCYEKAGFRPVGLMRSAWRDPEGSWRDVLLMELIELE
jgi:aminoglycoside 6'-N-acetyltransferase